MKQYRTIRKEIDELATDMSENLKGWIVAVEGYADSTRRTASNRSLSEPRASAVINYLASKHGLPPWQLVQAVGSRASIPVAAREARALRRRAEITSQSGFLVNSANVTDPVTGESCH